MLKYVLVILLLLYSTAASAAPFVVSDYFDGSLVDNCIVTVDGVENVLSPEVGIISGQERCVYDVENVSDGSHTVNMRTRNTWGDSTDVPFDFTKTLPPTLSNIRLEN